MSTTNKPVKTAARPGRTLAILALVLIAMTSLVFIQGAKSVRLGLDLRGGTSVTLQPRIAPGDEGKITSDAIDQAVSIIRQRVNSLGVAESEVSAQGSGTNRQIVISVPGDTGRRVVELVGQTAELRFRQVLAESSALGGTGAAAATPAADVSAEIMERNNLTADDVAWLVPHQANLRIIDDTAKRMGLTKDKVMININKYGNTTAATIPLCLWDWENKLKKGDNIVLAAFGGGFTWGSVYLKWAY